MLLVKDLSVLKSCLPSVVNSYLSSFLVTHWRSCAKVKTFESVLFVIGASAVLSSRKRLLPVLSSARRGIPHCECKGLT